MFNLRKFQITPKIIQFLGRNFRIPQFSSQIAKNFSKCPPDINRNFYDVDFNNKKYFTKNFLKLSKSNFSRKNSKYTDNSDDDLPEIVDYDLTELSLKEEIKFLIDKKDLKKANLKIEKLIDYTLTTKQINDDTIRLLEEYISTLSNNLRDMGLFEKSILTQEGYKVNLKNKINEEDNYDYLQVFLNDRIAFDYKILEKFDKTLEYLKENSQILQKRIDEDKLTLFEDRLLLQSNYLNLAESMIEENKDLEEINELLLKALELDKTIPDSEKNEMAGFRLFFLLGNVNSQLDNLEEALEHYKECLKLKRMQGIEEDEDCFRISKSIAEICLEMGDKTTALEFFEKCISIREYLLEYKKSASFDPDAESTEEDEKNHYIEIAKIYEAIAEVYHAEGNHEVTESLVNKAIESYHRHPLDDIYTGRCYMIIAEIFLEKKENEKCIEFSKRFLFAFTKFTKEKKKEIQGENFEMGEYSRLDFSEFLNMEYKAYKYIATCYFNLNENFKCKKYSEMAIDKLITLKEEGKKNYQSSEGNENLNDFINYKYELAQLYDLSNNQAMTIKEYNEVINKLLNYPDDEISVDEDSDEKLDKNIILVDAFVGKAEALFKLSRYSDAKKFLINSLDIIEKKNLALEEEKVQEIRKKIELINLKLKHSAAKNNGSNQ
jgi:tetratricopeptide (TPR) repeat protein